MPTPARQDAREAIQAIFLRIGVDIESDREIHDLRGNLQWIAEKRQREQQRSTFRSGLGLSGIAAILGAIITTVMEWLLHRFGK
jgi:hypothetical protein